MWDDVHGGTWVADLVYNFLMLGVDAAALVWIRRNARPFACITTVTA